MNLLNCEDLNWQIKQKAKEVGFASVGITVPDSIPEAKTRLAEFLENGYNGQMSWLKTRSNWRSDPKALWPEVRSVIVFSEVYTPTHNVLETLSEKNRGNISVYAHGRDYHDIIKKRLKNIARWLVSTAGAQVKVFVDTAPVMEKPLAQAAGLGWQGKHTNLVSRRLGNWFFIGVIFTDLEITPDDSETDHCGACTKCLQICPTAAFVGPYKIDARRCISYLTIEHKGPIDINLRSKLGNRIYGCDDCLAVCPWNKFATATTETKYFVNKHLNLQSLDLLATITDQEFRKQFSGSPIKRIGRDRFVRNVVYAMGNSMKTGFIGVLKSLTLDSDFSVRDAATWAISKIKRENG